jgi:hypothetical protein
LQTLVPEEIEDCEWCGGQLLNEVLETQMNLESWVFLVGVLDQ